MTDLFVCGTSTVGAAEPVQTVKYMHDRMIPKYNFEPGGAQAHRRMLEQFVDKWAKDECEYFHITLSWKFKDGVFEDTYKVTHRDGARGGFE